MKLLIVLGFLPLFSAASSLQFGSGRKFNQKALISTMETLAKNPDAAAAIAKIFNKDNICLRNMDEAIEGMKLASDMVKVTEGDLQALNNHVKRLDSLRGETEVLLVNFAVCKCGEGVSFDDVRESRTKHERDGEWTVAAVREQD